MAVPTISQATYCRWRAERSLRAPPPAAGAAAAVAAAGWLMSPESSAPYLALHARHPAWTRAALDQALLRERHVVRVRSVRGLTLLVPQADVLVAVGARGRRLETRLKRLARVVPITRGEVETVALAVEEVLAEGPASRREIEERLPAGMLRSFGPERRRAGATGILSVVLDYLEEEGKVLELPEGDRLEQATLRYHRLADVVPGAPPAAPDLLEVLPALLRHYLRAFGPARLEDFAWWAGTTQHRSETAAAALEPQPARLQVEGLAGEFLCVPEDLELLLAAKEEAREPLVAFLPSGDPYCHDMRCLDGPRLAVPRPECVCARHKGKPAPQRLLPTVVIDGVIQGVWEWEGAAGEVRYHLFRRPPPAVAKAVAAAAARMRRYIRAELEGEVFFEREHSGPHWSYRVADVVALRGGE